MEQYKNLDTYEKRIVGKLCRVLSTGKLTDKQMTSINRCISRHAPSDGKKRVSGYIAFYTLRYPVLKKKHPNASLGDIAKLVGKEWGSKTEKEKEVYKQKAKDH